MSVSGIDLGSRLLEALGVPKEFQVTEIHINCRAGDHSVVTVRHLINDEQGAKVVEVGKDYRLIPVVEEEEEETDG